MSDEAPKGGTPDIVPAGEGDWVVRAGDSIASIAHATGHAPLTLWNHAGNAPLRRARNDPEVLLPGDRVTVPPLVEGTYSCATAKRHVFRRKGVPVKVIFVVQDPKGKPFGGKDYSLRVGAKDYAGKTDANGRLEQWVDPSATTGQLTVTLATPGYPPVVVWTLKVGHLPPVGSLRGVQARLDNLAFSCGGEAGQLGPETQAALERFQRRHGLPVTREPDEATRGKLSEVYGA